MSGAAQYAPPKSYGEWLECLERLGSGGDDECLQAVVSGSFVPSPRLLERLEERVADAANRMLGRAAEAFARQLREAGEYGELDYVPVIYSRFAVKARSALFFENLAFLPDSFKAELRSSVEFETKRFRDGILRDLRKSFWRFPYSSTEDILLDIEKYPVFPRLEG